MFIITSISISLMFAEGGTRIFTVERKEMKATVKTAAFRPENEFSWKKVSKQITLRIQIGKKTVRMVAVGNW